MDDDCTLVRVQSFTCIAIGILFKKNPYCLVLLLYHSASGILSVRAICHFFPFFLRAFFKMCSSSLVWILGYMPISSSSVACPFQLVLLHLALYFTFSCYTIHSYICCVSIHSHCVRKTNDFEGTQWDEPFFNYTICLYCVIEKCISY